MTRILTETPVGTKEQEQSIGAFELTRREMESLLADARRDAAEAQSAKAVAEMMLRNEESIRREQQWLREHEQQQRISAEGELREMHMKLSTAIQQLDEVSGIV